MAVLDPVFLPVELNVPRMGQVELTSHCAAFISIYLVCANSMSALPGDFLKWENFQLRKKIVVFETNMAYLILISINVAVQFLAI